MPVVVEIVSVVYFLALGFYCLKKGVFDPLRSGIQVGEYDVVKRNEHPFRFKLYVIIHLILGIIFISFAFYIAA